MSYQQKRNPAGASGGASECVQADGNGNASEVAPNATQNQEMLDDLARARDHLETRAANLEVIARWRDDLRDRIQRGHLQFELIGLSDDEHQQLVEEAERFRRVCRALKWSVDGRGQP